MLHNKHFFGFQSLKQHKYLSKEKHLASGTTTTHSPSNPPKTKRKNLQKCAEKRREDYPLSVSTMSSMQMYERSVACARNWSKTCRSSDRNARRKLLLCCGPRCFQVPATDASRSALPWERKGNLLLDLQRNILLWNLQGNTFDGNTENRILFRKG